MSSDDIVKSNIEGKTRQEALDFVRDAEAFVVVTAREGRYEFRALIPERFPPENAQHLLRTAQQMCGKVDQVLRGQRNSPIVSAPPTFNPKKVN